MEGAQEAGTSEAAGSGLGSPLAGVSAPGCLDTENAGEAAQRAEIPALTVLAIAARQHGAARLAASGASLRDVASFLGVPLERARALLGRPAMVNLISRYRAGS